LFFTLDLQTYPDLLQVAGHWLWQKCGKQSASRRDAGKAQTNPEIYLMIFVIV